MKTLYGQMMAVTTAVLLVAVGVSLWAVFAYGMATARSRVAGELKTAVRLAAVAVATSGGVGLNRPPLIRRRRLLRGTLEVVDVAGRVFWRNGPGISTPTVLSALRKPHAASPLAQGNRLVAAAAVQRRMGSALYVVWQAPVRTPPFPTPTEQAVLGSGFLAFALAQILWALMARRLIGPLTELRKLLDRYSRGEFAARAAITGPEEFVHLAGDMERMAAALAQERDARESFFAEVAHDLRTPLTALRSLLASLQSSTSRLDSTQLRKRIGRAEAEAERLTRLVNDLLDLARYETGHLTVTLSPIDLREVAALGAVTGEAAAETRGIAFSVELPDEPIWVTGNVHRGTQVLVNLVDNAIRYTPKGGHVRVVAEQAGAHAAVRVEDSGPGFEQDATDWAWSAFVRGKAARENDGGTGLGLAVGKALAKLMGGDLVILPSQSTGGGRVELRLPVRSSPHGPQPVKTD